MNESPRDDSHNTPLEIPGDWRLVLVNSKMKVLATKGGLSTEFDNNAGGLEVADLLVAEQMQLAEIGELLVCLEDLPPECELRLRLGDPLVSIVVRGFADSLGISCIVLRPRADASAEKALPAAWSWAQAQIKSLSLKPKSEPVSVMVVDENPEIVEFGCTLLRKLGCRPVGAQNGGEALAKAKARRFELVLVDHFLPGFGINILTELLREKGSRDWGVAPLVVSMIKDLGHLGELETVGIEKPLSIGDLKVLVQLAKSSRNESAKDPRTRDELPVVQLDKWRDDRPLLCRLAMALVAQGSEIILKLGENAHYAFSREFNTELDSLLNGCDILHAARLGAVCRDLLDSGDMKSTSEVEELVIEIEGFRLFAMEHGLLHKGL